MFKVSITLINAFSFTVLILEYIILIYGIFACIKTYRNYKSLAFLFLALTMSVMLFWIIRNEYKYWRYENRGFQRFAYEKVSHVDKQGVKYVTASGKLYLPFEAIFLFIAAFLLIKEKNKKEPQPVAACNG